MTDSLTDSGSIDAYEFYVEVMLQFHCDDCGASSDCPVADSDDEAPRPPWATREGLRGMSLGWFVPPLTSDGSVRLTSYCPSCARRRGIRIIPAQGTAA